MSPDDDRERMNRHPPRPKTKKKTGETERGGRQSPSLVEPIPKKQARGCPIPMNRWENRAFSSGAIKAPIETKRQKKKKTGSGAKQKEYGVKKVPEKLRGGKKDCAIGA